MYKTGDDDLRARKAVSLNDALGECVETLVPEGARQTSWLWRTWEKVASAYVREHTDNVVFGKNKETVILVYVEDSSWAAELTMQKEFYRLRMESELSRPISEVKFLVSRKAYLRKR